MLGVVILRWNGTFDSRWLLASMEISWKMCEWVAVYKSPPWIFAIICWYSQRLDDNVYNERPFHMNTQTHTHAHSFFSSSGFQEIFQFDQILFDKWPSTLFAFWSPSLFAFMELLFPLNIYTKRKKHGCDKLSKKSSITIHLVFLFVCFKTEQKIWNWISYIPSFVYQMKNKYANIRET